MAKFQKFNTSSVESRFIKNLLKSTYIPMVDSVSDNDVIVAGVRYSYQNNIIECTDTGYLKGRFSAKALCGESSICGPTFICGKGQSPASYKILHSYEEGEFSPGVTTNFTSNKNDYGSGTHKQLGKYLRWYRSRYNIDLMPFYNCFINELTNDVHFMNNEIKIGSNNDYKVWMIPIVFNKTYNIYMESSTPVTIGATMLNDLGVLTYVNDSRDTIPIYVSNKIITYTSTRFYSPITYRVDNIDSKYFDYKDNLYLLIQVPYSSNNPILVLEGDNIISDRQILSRREIFIDNHIDMDVILNHPEWYEDFTPQVIPSLTWMPTQESIPYSNTLIEYLLEYPITSEEDIRNNISRVQNKLGVLNKYNLPRDVWTNLLRFIVYNTQLTYSNNRFDAIGFVDKNAERALSKYENIRSNSELNTELNRESLK